MSEKKNFDDWNWGDVGELEPPPGSDLRAHIKRHFADTEGEIEEEIFSEKKPKSGKETGESKSEEERMSRREFIKKLTIGLAAALGGVYGLKKWAEWISENDKKIKELMEKIEKDPRERAKMQEWLREEMEGESK